MLICNFPSGFTAQFKIWAVFGLDRANAKPGSSVVQQAGTAVGIPESTPSVSTVLRIAQAEQQRRDRRRLPQPVRASDSITTCYHAFRVSQTIRAEDKDALMGRTQPTRPRRENDFEWQKIFSKVKSCPRPHNDFSLRRVLLSRANGRKTRLAAKQTLHMAFIYWLNASLSSLICVKERVTLVQMYTWYRLTAVDEQSDLSRVSCDRFRYTRQVLLFFWIPSTVLFTLHNLQFLV